MDQLTYLPLLLAAITPLCLIHYLTASDLQSRIKLFFAALLVSVLYMKIIIFLQSERTSPLINKKIERFRLTLPPGKKLICLFSVALLIYSLSSLTLISRGVHFAGDEPHYLLISHSLIKDGDFDLKNNYSRKDYRSYMHPSVTIDPHIAPGTNNRYSFHSPGISLLILPFYAAGLLLKGKWLFFLVRFGVGIFGALLSIQFYLFIRKKWNREFLSLGLWALFSFSAPILFYSIHVYPEIIAALISFYIFRQIHDQHKKISSKTAFFLGILLVGLLWFHAVKYVFIIGPLFFYTLWMLRRPKETKYPAYFFLAGCGLSGIAYFTFQFSLYGSFSLSAVSWQGKMSFAQSLAYFKSIFFDTPFRFRWETLAGYFLDQRDGLLLYSPIYVFAFFGMVEAAKVRLKSLLILLFLTAPYILSSAWLTQRTGYAPQARPLVGVFWGIGIFLGYYLASEKKVFFNRLFSLTCVISLFIPVLLLLTPRFLYQLTTFGEIQRAGDFFLSLSNLHLNFTSFLPSFLKIENGLWLPNIFWLGGLFFLILIYSISRPGRIIPWTPEKHLAFILTALLSFFFLFVYFPATPIGNPRKLPLEGGGYMNLYDYSRSTRVLNPKEFRLLENNRDYVFYFSTPLPLKNLNLEFGEEGFSYKVKIEYFDETIFSGIIEDGYEKVSLISLQGYPFKKHNLFRIRITIHPADGSETKRAYFLFKIQPELQKSGIS